MTLLSMCFVFVIVKKSFLNHWSCLSSEKGDGSTAILSCFLLQFVLGSIHCRSLNSPIGGAAPVVHLGPDLGGFGRSTNSNETGTWTGQGVRSTVAI